ncbi:sigma-54-dependent Fis family transcriptional regulator [Undibacterium sp. RTI2.1]|uniref:sigma-54-dependent Fis family transcriptional regulator n=1 Tax=unclassified Undibacterium TaxID=2630295 RepID=UPI002AB4FEF7|nr:MULTISPECIES: sigma-54-dependent Fis family transcriptional regulator [unclassified Undibacterium]MDY7538379.1 sigma-54-dependent Fis family transcriptional regulator [Undibacterium sp. 5I1]MEB0030094.1 sigma-54-dependent Fis family transcriptional regulator [Undibacterium sp. RTI2.1]MEB0114997.1 sigma-54-dependent Fis family transcriptional regulator [Undibacterium sp. RTI2.2]MEB0232957.1 sigma-54-dependent Fis family transcriptional regulator [Undibacterium sp. 10I3]MEB0255956.1 sigma-54-
MRQIMERGNDGAQATPLSPSQSDRFISAGTHPELLAASHLRSAAYGVERKAAPDFSSLSNKELALLMEQNHALHTYALPVMETLYEQIIDTHSMVLLTDANGHILHAFGDQDFLQKADQVAIRPGVMWAEHSKGTNAIGTALVEAAPTLIHGSDHYLQANHFLTCSAAPIFDYQGKVLGVLDVTGDYRSFHKHTMALVRMSAQMIENQLFSATFEDAITLHFHARPEFIGTLMEGIACFTPDGRFLSANRSALFQLGLPLASLTAHSFSSLFGVALSSLLDHYRNATAQFLSLSLPGGVRVSARAELKLKNSFSQYAQGQEQERQDYQKASENHHPAANYSSQNSPSNSSKLKALNTGDPLIANLINKISKVAEHDISLLITGETGTGKELLAQAIHQDSSRRQAAFIAVNCASIPETLIESELFGYEDGAFTGARKKGNIGKIQQAHGGTLFLDEIGDMPLSMQARLLRVLQERSVMPLGGNKSIHVDVKLICATHRNLRELIAKGEFREDLYYRLNGLVLKLPALRERSDMTVLAQRMLAEENRSRHKNGKPHQISSDVMQLFKHHRWPGNLRQLNNLLRTAMLMAGENNEICREHLPEDFLEEITTLTEYQPTLDQSVTHVSHVTPDINQAVFNDLSSANAIQSVQPISKSKLQDLEIQAIQTALQIHGGNVSAAARALGVSRNTIYRKR